MSWSMGAKGTRTEITAELERFGGALSGHSKDEYERAKPHLVALVDLCWSETYEICVELSAWGSGSFTGQHGEPETRQTASECGVTLRRI